VRHRLFLASFFRLPFRVLAAPEFFRDFAEANDLQNVAGWSQSVCSARGV
jgi:hypothetical protein